MGASKRLAELVVQAYAIESDKNIRTSSKTSPRFAMVDLEMYSVHQDQ